MSSPDMTLIMVAVPIGGPDDAEPWRKIHKRAGCWAPTTARNYLTRLYQEGKIQGRQEPHPSAGFQWLYWREGA